MKDGLSFVMVMIMAVNLIIWLGLALYLFNIDRRMRKLEKKNRNQRDIP